MISLILVWTINAHDRVNKPPPNSVKIYWHSNNITVLGRPKCQSVREMAAVNDTVEVGSLEVRTSTAPSINRHGNQLTMSRVIVDGDK